METASNRVLVFKVTRFWWMLLLSFIVIGALAFAVLPVVWICNDPQWSPLQCALLGLGVAVVAFTVWALPKCGRYQLEIHPDFIRYQSAFKATELRFENIEGYRILPAQYVETLVLSPKTKAHKKLQTALVFQRKPELLAWLAANLTDLNLRDQNAARAQVLADTNLGTTEAERQCRLANAKKWTRTLTAITYLAFAWALFYPHPYRQSIGLLIAIPLLALVAIVLSRGAIRFDGKPTDHYPNVTFPFFMSGLTLTLRAYLDSNILRWTELIGPVALLTVSISVALCLADAHLRKKTGTVIVAILMGILYSYGTVVYINCAYDRSEPRIYESFVRHAHAAQDRAPYCIVLEPFVDGASSREVLVPEKVYLAHPVGSPIQIHVLEGKLGVAWFRVQ